MAHLGIIPPQVFGLISIIILVALWVSSGYILQYIVSLPSEDSASHKMFTPLTLAYFSSSSLILLLPITFMYDCCLGDERGEQSEEMGEDGVYRFHSGEMPGQIIGQTNGYPHNLVDTNDLDRSAVLERGNAALQASRWKGWFGSLKPSRQQEDEGSKYLVMEDDANPLYAAYSNKNVISDPRHGVINDQHRVTQVSADDILKNYNETARRAARDAARDPTPLASGNIKSASSNGPSNIAVILEHRQYGSIEPKTFNFYSSLYKIGLLLLICGIFLFYRTTWILSVKETTISINSVVYNSYVFVVPLFALTLLKNSSVTALKSLCLCVGFFGILVISVGSGKSAGAVTKLNTKRGIVLTFLSAICYGLYTVLLKKYHENFKGPSRSKCLAIRLTGYQGVITLLLGLIISYILHLTKVQSFELPFRTKEEATYLLITMVYNILYYSILAFALELCSPVMVAGGSVMVAPVSFIIDWLVLGEKSTYLELAGCLLVFVSFIVITFEEIYSSGYLQSQQDAVDTLDECGELSGLLPDMRYPEAREVACVR